MKNIYVILDETSKKLVPYSYQILSTHFGVKKMVKMLKSNPDMECNIYTTSLDLFTLEFNNKLYALYNGTQYEIKAGYNESDGSAISDLSNSNVLLDRFNNGDFWFLMDNEKEKTPTLGERLKNLKESTTYKGCNLNVSMSLFGEYDKVVKADVLVRYMLTLLYIMKEAEKELIHLFGDNGINSVFELYAEIDDTFAEIPNPYDIFDTVREVIKTYFAILGYYYKIESKWTDVAKEAEESGFFNMCMGMYTYEKKKDKFDMTSGFNIIRSCPVLYSNMPYWMNRMFSILLNEGIPETIELSE